MFDFTLKNIETTLFGVRIRYWRWWIFKLLTSSAKKSIKNPTSGLGENLPDYPYNRVVLYWKHQALKTGDKGMC